MKTFIKFCIVLIVFLPLIPTISRGQETIEGNYIIYSGDQQIETDAFSITVGLKYEDEIVAAGKQERRDAVLKYINGSLGSYQQTLNGLPSFSATVENTMVKLYENEALKGAFPTEGEVFLLDMNIYSQYSMLVTAFTKKNTAKGRIEVLIPQLQDLTNVDLERHGSDDFIVGGKTISATHIRIMIGKRETINCWVDGNRIIGMYLASKNIYIADNAYAGAYENLKKIVNRAM